MEVTSDVMDAALAGMADLATDGDATQVWESAANHLAFLAGPLIQRLAARNGTTVAEEISAFLGRDGL